MSEHAEMWVSFETLWADETAHASGTAFSAIVVPSGFIFPHDFVFHAKDATGNEATMPGASRVLLLTPNALGQREGRLH